MHVHAAGTCTLAGDLLSRSIGLGTCRSHSAMLREPLVGVRRWLVRLRGWKARQVRTSSSQVEDSWQLLASSDYWSKFCSTETHIMHLFVTLTCMLCLAGWVPAAPGQNTTRIIALPSTTYTLIRPAAVTIALPDCAVSEYPYIYSESFWT